MKKYISEFVGTFSLTFFACGVAVTVGCSTPAGIIATALAFGLVIVAMAYSIGNVSGCHINPAVTIATFIDKRINRKDCIFYIIAQILGALAGSLVLALCLGSFKALGANAYGGMLPNDTKVSLLIAFIIETVLTFFFITVILTVTKKKEHSNIAGIIIGLTLVLIHLLGIPFTGTSVNPARSLAPALLQGGEALKQVWVFIVAPIIGGVLATLFYKFVLKEEEEKKVTLIEKITPKAKPKKKK